MATIEFEIERTLAESIVAEPEVHDPLVIDPRVQRGVEFLDEREPGWAKFIDLDYFHLIDGNQCVFGQIERNRHGANKWVPGHNSSPYVAALRRYGLSSEGVDSENPPSLQYGVYAKTFADFKALEADWRLVIAERQLA